ncbi:MAG: Bro-N domain-containing protein [Synergistaceae bacterium]|nr:Bro-N domain-containing protein [Synergistaceae bacterium]
MKKNKGSADIAIFCYKSMPVRTTIIDGEVWFIAKDVCNVLEIGNSRDAVSSLDDDEKGVAKTDTLGGMQDMTVISEAGLYALIMKSRKPEAKAFSRWVRHDVLPQIQKTGSYALPNAPQKGKSISLSKKVLDAAEKICEKAFACKTPEDFRNTIALDNVFKNTYGTSALEMAGISLSIKDEPTLFDKWDSDGCHIVTREIKHSYEWRHNLLPPLPEDKWDSWYEE